MQALKACILYKGEDMFFCAQLETENYIYLIEGISRSLISIHISSGETKIEARLPLKYTGNDINMLLWKHSILICSPVMDHFLIYDCWEQKIRVIELQERETDEVGVYHSNILIDQDDFIILPFKGKTIERYGMNGELKSKDDKWYLSIDKEYNSSRNMLGNIRVHSACIVGDLLFFSLVYKEQNYLCQYELNEGKHLCNIAYYSENIAIRGVYVYSNMVLFRRIFPDKTEIVMFFFEPDEKKTIIIDYPSTFEGDVYGDIDYLKVSLKNEILAIDGKDLNQYQKVYNFGQHDIYIANGILFNTLKNEILIPDVNGIRKYSLEKTVKEIKNSSFYQQEYRKLFNDKLIYEGRYQLYDLVRYLTDAPPLMNERERYLKNKYIGECVWNTI